MASHMIREKTFLKKKIAVFSANDFKSDSHRRVSIKSSNIKTNDRPCNLGHVRGIKPRVEWVMNK